MIFSQQARFSLNKPLDVLIEDEEEKEEDEWRRKSDMFMPSSTLSDMGTKIVDSCGQMGINSLSNRTQHIFFRNLISSFHCCFSYCLLLLLWCKNKYQMFLDWIIH